jgi:hypothetical protein
VDGPAGAAEQPLVPGATRNRVPFAQRGRVGLELALGLAKAGLSDLDAADYRSHAAATVVATIPVARASFFEAMVPLSIFQSLGSPTFGLHHVADVADGVWITGGGAVGLPMTVGRQGTDGYTYDPELVYPRALWDAHLYFGPMMPFQAKFGLEYHVGAFGLRVELEPALWVLIEQHEDFGGSFPHALELQAGHEIGAGVRVQGVLAGAEPDRGRGPIVSDHYQFAVNPYFVVHRDAAALRIGMMLPLDEALGPPFERSFGLLVDAAVNLD